MNLLYWTLLGAASWTLLEHLIHDYLGHRGRGRNPFGREHVKHHATTSYFAPAWKKALVAGPVVLMSCGLFASVLGGRAGFAYASGLSVMYLAYEIVHRRRHTRAPLGAYGRFLRRHHFHHHFHDPRVNLGVTTPLWDWVFGTYEKAGLIMVPQRQAMDWLIEPFLGGIPPAFADDYELRPTAH